MLKDNIQRIDASRHFEKNWVYVGKQNIRDHSVSLPPSEYQQFQSKPWDGTESAELSSETESPGALDVQVPARPNQTLSAPKQLQETPQNDDEGKLQAQIRLMKKKLQVANQKLIDIQVNDRKETD